VIGQIKFLKPESVSQAVNFLQAPGSKALAGGTDFIVKHRNGLFPGLTSIVDITSLPLKSIIEGENDITIQSGCTMTKVIEDSIIQKFFPALTSAASTVGALQIRNLATLGGNCANASPAGDTIPALFSLETQIMLSSNKGSRIIPIEDFFNGPGKTIMAKDEIIEAFIIPKRETFGAFKKLGERKAHAIAKINLAISIWKTEEKLECRIAMGSVAPTVIRITSVEKLIEEKGLPLEDKNLAHACELACEAAKPIDDIRSTKSYRKQMAGVLLKRVLADIKL
jgi:CO/xanthine dehydrogenase FAD-binding subunit